MAAQSTNHIMLIEPAEFYANPQTMETNLYQTEGSEPHEITLEKAIQEQRELKNLLVSSGIAVSTVRGQPGCPDHLFPNNWVSTHEGKQMILYPMLNENRRAERTPSIIQLLQNRYESTHDLSSWEVENKIVEGTGSLCLDRINKIVYAALSQGTSELAVQQWAHSMDYDTVIFNTSDNLDMPVYHTNVLMFIGSEVAGICTDWVADDDKEFVMEALLSTHEVIELTNEQGLAFCGNGLELFNEHEQKFIVFSSGAYNALGEDNKIQLDKYYADILHVPMPTIESYGGGSARCLMLELF